MENRCTPKAEAYQRAAELAPQLTDSQLRTFIEIIRRTDARGKTIARLQDLQTATRRSRRTVQYATRRLVELGQITRHRGRQHQATIHRLTESAPEVQRTAPADPPEVQPIAPLLSEVQPTAPLNPNQPPRGATHCTPETPEVQPIAPTPTRKEATEDRNAHTHAQDETRAPVESNQVLSVLEVSKIDRRASANATKAEKIDRLLNAKPEDFEPETHAWASHHLQHHHSAFSPHLPSRPPDRQQTAELLTAAEVLQQDERYGLLAMLEELKMARLLPGKGWGWYITVAADKCAGIPAAELKAARQQRAQARKQASAATAAAPDNPNFRADLMSGILAGAKTMPTARGARR